MKIVKSISMSVILLPIITIISFAQSTNTAQTADSLKSVSIKVKGITCSADLNTIAVNVEKLKGVKSCKAAKPGATTTFTVNYYPAMVSEMEIHAAIEGTGGCENPDEKPYKVKQ